MHTKQMYRLNTVFQKVKFWTGTSKKENPGLEFLLSIHGLEWTEKYSYKYSCIYQIKGRVETVQVWVNK